MDLQDFDGAGLYFDDPTAPQVEALLARAAERYAEGGAEIALLQAEALAPDSLSVLVGLYRFHYYQHRLGEALAVAERVLAVLAGRLDLPSDWRLLALEHLDANNARIGLLRLHLLALKGAGYLSLRLGRFEQGKAMLAKVAALDADDRLGARLLLGVLAEHDAQIIAFPIAPPTETRS